SQNEVEYPELCEIHEASSLQTPEDVADWRTRTTNWGTGVHTRPPISVPPRNYLSNDSIEQVILRRGSTRKFERQSIPLDQLRAILEASTQPVWPGFSLLNHLYLIVSAVDGTEPGAYYFHVDTAELELLKPGNFRGEARYLGLQQDLPGDAAADLFF